jgi:hypothetical protein
MQWGKLRQVRVWERKGEGLLALWLLTLSFPTTPVSPCVPSSSYFVSAPLLWTVFFGAVLFISGSHSWCCHQLWQDPCVLRHETRF